MVAPWLRNPGISANGLTARQKRFTSTRRTRPTCRSGHPGLGSSVEKIDERWFVETSEGRVGFAFVQRNENGILDHYVTLPSEEVIYIPMRVIADDGGCEVVFTLRRRPGTSDEDFRADAAAVAADLTRLKHVCERR